MTTKTLEQSIVSVELSTGATIPLRPIRAIKTGNVYHAVLKRKLDGSYYNPGKYGVKVDASVVGGALPTSVTIAGQKVNAVKGTTTSGNPKVSFSARVLVNTQERILRMSISRLPNGDFNVSGSLHRPGGFNSQAVSSL